MPGAAPRSAVTANPKKSLSSPGNFVPAVEEKTAEEAFAGVRVNPASL